MKSLTQSIYPSYNNNIIIWDEISDLLVDKFVTIHNSEATYSNTTKVSEYQNQIQFNTKQFVLNPNSDINFNCTDIVTATSSINQYVFVNTEYTYGFGETQSTHPSVMFLNASKDKNISYVDNISNTILNKGTTFKTSNLYNTSLSYMSSTSSYINKINYNINNNVYTLTNILTKPNLISRTFSTSNTSFTYSKVINCLDDNYKNLRFDIPSGKQLETIFSTNILNDYSIDFITLTSTSSFTNGDMDNLSNITVINPSSDALVQTSAVQYLSPTRSLEISVIPISISTYLNILFNISGLEPNTKYTFEFSYYPRSSVDTGDDAVFNFTTDTGTHTIPSFNYNYPDLNAGYIGLDQWNTFGQYTLTTGASTTVILTMQFQPTGGSDGLTVQTFFDNFRLYKETIKTTAHYILDNNCNKMDQVQVMWKNQNGAFDFHKFSYTNKITNVYTNIYNVNDTISDIGGTKELNGIKQTNIRLYSNYLEDYEVEMIEDLFYSNEIYIIHSDNTKTRYILMNKEYTPIIKGKSTLKAYVIELSEAIKNNLNY